MATCWDKPLALFILTDAIFYNLIVIVIRLNILTPPSPLRERKGPFKTIDDLVKVRGINSRVLSILKVYLTLNDLAPSSPPLSDVTSVASYSKVYQRNLDGKLSGEAGLCCYSMYLFIFIYI